ncbi:hypothetical protein SAMN04488102_11018 [Alkalibacterium subtropicum]|uniref:Uncharacterized protein n=1 Tax=Alkalibacterium subtropicum TaxID=753702 RepID=A0A1I1K1U4_9LACT|nr:hypothetical protein [Alkalibacterium subtropicum]SFC54814.1 hypothetical protein SAMN04488102_11018 [Alkalibacterium subtropicum]
MEKLKKVLVLTLTGGMFLVGCEEIEDVNEELPDVEEPSDPIAPELDENPEEDMNE